MKQGIVNRLLIAAAIVPAIFLLSFAAINVREVKDFSLKNVDGAMVSLKDYPNAKGFIIVFTCNHCPFAQLYYKRLNELNAKYAAKGVPLLAISSTDTINYEDDSFEKMVLKAKLEQLNFPYLYDNTQQVAKDFKAQKTPHAYVIWKVDGKWVVKYSGAIDDNGAHAELANNHYVAAAIDELLVGKEVSIKDTKSIGCQISFRK